MPLRIDARVSPAPGIVSTIVNLPALVSKGERDGLRLAAIETIHRVLERINRLRPNQNFRGKFKAKREASFAKAVAAGALSEDFLFVRSGKLRASLTKVPVVEGGAGAEFFVRVGFKSGMGVDEYAPVHEFGTSRAGRSHNVVIRARRPLGHAADETRQYVRPLMQREIARAIAAGVKS